MSTFQQYEDTEHAGNHFLIGMLCGVALGAVAGLLLAPRRGSELREQVADSMNRASRRAADTYTKASETMNDIAERAADIAGNLSDRAATLTARLNRTLSSRTIPPVS
jgi:gas vesicle protein